MARGEGKQPVARGPPLLECRTYLENLLRMRPAGVVSKKTIGERKMANAIRSCNFLLA